MLGAACKIAKCKQWIKAVKNYVENPKDWTPNKNTRVCSSHFINNEKSEHPLHPSYVPSIFLGSKNIKKKSTPFQRFQRVKNHELLKVSSINKFLVSKETNNFITTTNTINAVMEQDDDVQQNQTDIDVESVILKQYNEA